MYFRLLEEGWGEVIRNREDFQALGQQIKNQMCMLA
jgi:hypothetical protein